MNILLFSVIIIISIILLQSRVLKPNLCNLGKVRNYYPSPIYLNSTKQMYKHKSNRLRFSKKAKLKNR